MKERIKNLTLKLKAIPTRKKLLVYGVLSLLVLIIVAGTVIWVVKGKESKDQRLTTTATASLEAILENSGFSTLRYPYNAVTEVKKKDSDEVKYYVSYEGVVSVGINFEEIKIDIDNKNNTINVTLPKTEVQDVSVDIDTLDFIFLKSKYETETVSQEAYKASLKDLKTQAEKQESLHEIARENAKSAINALFAPFVEQVLSNYTIVVK